MGVEKQKKEGNNRKMKKMDGSTEPRAGVRLTRPSTRPIDDYINIINNIMQIFIFACFCAVISE